MKIYSNDKIIYPNKNRDSRYGPFTKGSDIGVGIRQDQNVPNTKPMKSSSLRSVKYNPNRKKLTNSNTKSPSQNSNYSFSSKKNIVLDLDSTGM